MFDSQVDHNDNEDAFTDSQRYESSGLVSSYCPSWEESEAFREIVQNAEDCMKVSSEEEKLITTRNEKSTLNGTEITITYRRPINAKGTIGGPDILGFIRFHPSGKGDGCGWVEVSNFEANPPLKAENLRIGSTSKRDNDQLAGHHGEGLKLAALVFCRQGTSVRVEASSFHIDFRINQTNHELAYKSTKPLKTILEKIEADYAMIPEPRSKRWSYQTYITKDVTVQLGKSTSSVKESQFRQWLSLSLAVVRPSIVVETEYGDLILDPEYKGRVFLDGLELPKAQSIYQFQYSYNFKELKVDRDRSKFMDTSDMSKDLAGIWAKAMDTKGESFVTKYINLFDEHETATDIYEAPSHMEDWGAEVIWNMLLADAQRNGYFYYKETDGHFESVITKDLRKMPKPLHKRLWNLLNFSDVGIRNPIEECSVILNERETFEPPLDNFSAHVIRMLRAVLQLCSECFAGLRFVNAPDIGVNISYDRHEKVLTVNSTQLDFELAHSDNPCNQSEAVAAGNWAQTDSTGFDCDHIVLELFSDALREIACATKTASDFRNYQKKSQLNDARCKLLDVPREVSVFPSTQKAGIQVEWTSSRSHSTVKRMLNDKVIVVLHGERTCSRINDARGELIFRTDSPSCGCPRRIVDNWKSKAYFGDLDLEDKYFPMVAKHADGSIFAVPPVLPISPPRFTTEAEPANENQRERIPFSEVGRLPGYSYSYEFFREPCTESAETSLSSPSSELNETTDTTTTLDVDSSSAQSPANSETSLTSHSDEQSSAVVPCKRKRTDDGET